MTFTKTAQGPGDTYFIGESLAAFCVPNTNILLDGDLAAGKTVFAKGLGAGLGVEGNIKSPTYTLMCSYAGETMPFFHFDAYNLASMDDFYALGFDEFLYAGGVAVIEWAAVLGDGFPEDYIHVQITKGPGEDDRTLTFSAHGQAAQSILKEWRNHENSGL